MQKRIGVEEWKALFRGIGIDEAGMEKWHRSFETKHPEGHRSFLEWLGLSGQDIQTIRNKSR